MQDKEFQQPPVQHTKAHNWALYASLSASCLTIFLAISAVSLAFIYVFAIADGSEFFVGLLFTVVAIVCGDRALNNRKYVAELYGTHRWQYLRCCLHMDRSLYG